jgi:hypothetical protein
MSDLQSFTPLRFMPPKLMGYEGRAVVIDPDVFAVGDINELLSRDMEGKAVMGRRRSHKEQKAWQIATSAMLLDCEKLRHWDAEKEFEELFHFKRDYKDWIVLRHEPPENVGVLEDEWNDFDRLTEKTKLLHTTKRRTQPWKTGLPIDYTNRVPWIGKLLPRASIRWPGRYKAHPDPRQEAYFFALLKECVDTGQISRAALEREMKLNHVRHDALALIDTARPVDELLDRLRPAA